MAVIPAIAGGAIGALADAGGPLFAASSAAGGPVGTAELMEAKVLVIGAERSWGAGVACLALAGVGTIGIVDFDVVDLSNLQRQVLHRTDDVGGQGRVGARHAARLQPR